MRRIVGGLVGRHGRGGGRGLGGRGVLQHGDAHQQQSDGELNEASHVAPRHLFAENKSIFLRAI